MTARGLTQAKRLFRARRYTDVLRLLEPQIFRYRQDAEYYTLVGLSCLYTGEIGGAETYLGRAVQLDDENMQALLGLAVVHAGRREPDAAVACWLKVLDHEPRNRSARRGLDLLRASPDVAPGDRILRSLVPRPRRPVSGALLAALGVVAAALGLSYGVVRFVDARQAEPRPGIAEISLPSGSPEILGPQGDASITLTEREVIRTFTRARGYLLEYRDNLAIHELNRLLLSNASQPVKERALLLMSFVTEPDFSTIRDSFAYAVVRESPREYDGCYVRWSGRAANAVIGSERITFDLLAGYQDGRVLEGVVPTSLAFAASIENGAAYEVLGRVEVTEAAAITLEAVSVRPLHPGEGS
jgi:tetratricopeptide (TPR) repeat protein